MQERAIEPPEPPAPPAPPTASDRAGNPSELAAWLRLAAVPGLGPVTAGRLLGRFGTPAQLFAADPDALAALIPLRVATALLARPDAAVAAQIERSLAWAAQPGHHLVPRDDPRYPPLLRATADPPLVLHAQGRIDLLGAPQVAIVGSRHASAQGRLHARAMARDLALAGVTVTSGMALGIDAAAHEGALEGAGSTVAVIGTGCDQVYPPAHRGLAARIVEAGLMVSEFPLGTAPLAGNFPRRNRIIAGLARGVVVIEAAARSGSLITARLALEEGRDVCAMPGPVHAPLARGCHRLIKDGAALVEDATDVLAVLALEPVGAIPPQADRSDRARTTATASHPARAALDAEPARVLAVLAQCEHADPAPPDFDRLAAVSGLPAADLAGVLLELELGHRITRLAGGRYQGLE